MNLAQEKTIDMPFRDKILDYMSGDKLVRQVRVEGPGGDSPN